MTRSDEPRAGRVILRLSCGRGCFNSGERAAIGAIPGVAELCDLAPPLKTRPCVVGDRCHWATAAAPALLAARDPGAAGEVPRSLRGLNWRPPARPRVSARNAHPGSRRRKDVRCRQSNAGPRQTRRERRHTNCAKRVGRCIGCGEGISGHASPASLLCYGADTSELQSTSPRPGNPQRANLPRQKTSSVADGAICQPGDGPAARPHHPRAYAGCAGPDGVTNRRQPSGPADGQPRSQLCMHPGRNGSVRPPPRQGCSCSAAVAWLSS